MKTFLFSQKFRFILFLSFTVSFTVSCGVQNKRFYEPQNWRQALSDLQSRKSTPKASKASRSFQSSPAKSADFSNNTVESGQPGKYFYGQASWYGSQFHGKKTANGEIFDKRKMTAAHKFLPLGAIIEVQNLENGRVLQVRINDRGPYVDNRVLDLSEMAATRLGFRDKGLAKIKFRVVRLPKGTEPTDNFEDYKKHVVQVAAFKKRSYADRYKNSLKKKYQKLPVKVQEMASASKFHVVVGPYNRRTDARYILGDLENEGIHGLVRSYKK